MYVTEEIFGSSKRIWLQNKASVEGIDAGSLKVAILSYGCVINEIWCCDKNGHLVNVTLNFDSLEGYKSSVNPYFGAIIGRYANRIAKGEFILDGKTYTVDKNERNQQTLHGGSHGWDKVEWTYVIEETEHESRVVMTHISPNGDMGFPGSVEAKVTYTVPKERCELIYEVGARTTDGQSTVINMTNHAYFNLKGHQQGNIEDHKCQIMSSRFVEVTADCIPTGTLKNVEGTAFDFREPKLFSQDISNESDPDIKIGKGYDHCFELIKDEGRPFRNVATFLSQESGIEMTCGTDCPCAQLYTGNWIDIPQRYGRRAGFAFETGNAASAMHFPVLPNCILRPDQEYHHKTSFAFRQFAK